MAAHAGTTHARAMLPSSSAALDSGTGLDSAGLREVLAGTAVGQARVAVALWNAAPWLAAGARGGAVYGLTTRLPATARLGAVRLTARR